MIRRTKTADLRPGMYVLLPEKWFRHPFLRSRFTIRSERQLARLQESGIEEVLVDASRSAPPPAWHRGSAGEEQQTWNPLQDITAEMEQAIRVAGMPPRERARVAYAHALRLMKALMGSPKADCIREGKKGISRIVDLILSEEDTALNLLTVSSHDFYTYTHSVNVGILSVWMAKHMYRRRKGHDMHELGAGFFLHDLGKTTVPAEILNKPTRLNERETRIMRSHPHQGCKILERSSLLSETCAWITMQHHEQEDGGGYPRGLRGRQIHEYARICSIADVYDALTSERAYKKPMAPLDALLAMRAGMKGHFHPETFERFVMLFKSVMHELHADRAGGHQVSHAPGRFRSS